jgi:hypothetical protein
MRSTTTWKSYVLGAAAATALLATAACDPGAATGADADAEDTKPSVQVSETSAAKPDDGAVAACADKDLSISASHWDGPDAETVRHILITAKNVGDEKCALHHYPLIQLGDAQGPAPAIEDSKDELVTVAPGAEGYAALLVSGGGMDEAEVSSMALTLQGADGSESGEPVGVDLPGVDSLFMDDGVRVTYWGPAEGLVTDFIKNR